VRFVQDCYTTMLINWCVEKCKVTIERNKTLSRFNTSLGNTEDVVLMFINNSLNVMIFIPYGLNIQVSEVKMITVDRVVSMSIRLVRLSTC
jgi:hypothetical protein